MSNKARGNRAEKELRDMLQEAGYEVCKAGRSLGLFDLVAVRPPNVARFIQVKSSQNANALKRTCNNVAESITDLGYASQGATTFEVWGRLWMVRGVKRSKNDKWPIHLVL